MTSGRTASYFICNILNKPFTRPRPPGRESYEAYAEYEYSMAKHTLDELRPIEFVNKIVLDIGCGMGGKSVFLAQQGVKKLIAIDIEPKRLETGKTFAQLKQIPDSLIEFVKADATKLPFNHDQFDIIVANDSFEHLPDLQNTLSECFRVLKPGGYLGFNLLPYRSRDGAHLYDYIQIPWCQYVLPESWLVEYWKTRFEADYNSGDFRAFYTSPDQLRDIRTIQGLAQVNKLSLKEMGVLLDKTGFKLVREERVCSQKLSLFRHVPILNEFVTYAYKAVYQKP